MFSQEDPRDSVYGAAWDSMMRSLATDARQDLEVPQTPVYGLEKVTAAPAHHQPSVLPLDPHSLPLAPLGPHAAGGTLRQRAAHWVSSRTGIQTLAATVAGPSLVWTVAEISASQSILWTGMGAAGAMGIGGALTLFALDRRMDSPVALAGAGIATVGLQTAMAAAPSPWTGFVGWLISATTAGTLRVVYANRRKEPDAKVRIMENQARLIDMKAMTERHKAEAYAYKARLTEAKLHREWLTIDRMTQPEIAPAHHGLSYTPQLRGDENATETALLYALTPGRWADESEARGLAGTSVLRCALTDAGVELDLRLDGRWDAGKLAAQEGTVRAMASIPTSTRMHIGPGSWGDVARVLIRTRSASDGLSLTWEDGRPGIGLDEITGDVVKVELRPGNHLLVAGVTGTGKSFSWRPLAVEATGHDLWSVILLDPKRQEAATWAGKLGRTVGDQKGDNDGIRQMVYETLCELRSEMLHRQETATGSTWDATPEYPFLLVVIEEGRQLVEMSRDKRWSDVLRIVDDLYTLSRSAGFQLLWATQYPAKGEGIPQMVAENTVSTVCLTTTGPVADRVVFGENAQSTGWEPSKLDGVPGRALVKTTGRGPNPVRIWHVTDEALRALPDARRWETRAPVIEPEMPSQGTAPTGGNRALVRDFLEENPGATHRQVAEATGVPYGSVGRIIRQLD